MQAVLYANLTNGKLSEPPGGADFDWPELIEGDTLRLELHFTGTLGEKDVEIDPAVRLVRASLGRIDARPTGGRWAIQIIYDADDEARRASGFESRVPENPGTRFGNRVPIPKAVADSRTMRQCNHLWGWTIVLSGNPGFSKPRAGVRTPCRLERPWLIPLPYRCLISLRRSDV